MGSDHDGMGVWFIWFSGDLVIILIEAVESYWGDLVVCLDEEFSRSVGD